MIDKFPSRMLPQKEQQIVTMMGIQVIHDGRDPLQIGRQLPIHPTENIEKVGLGAPWIALGITGPRGLPQRAENVAFASSSIVEFLLSTLCWPSRDVDELLARIALRRNWTHLINIENGTLFRRL